DEVVVDVGQPPLFDAPVQLRDHLVAKTQRAGLVALVGSVQDLSQPTEVDLPVALEGPELTPVPILGTHVLVAGVFPVDLELDGAKQFVSRSVSNHHATFFPRLRALGRVLTIPGRSIAGRDSGTVSPVVSTVVGRADSGMGSTTATR